MSLPHLISPAAAPFNFPTQDYRLASSCTQAAGCGRHLSLRKDSSIKIPEAQRLLEDTGRNMCPSTTLQPWQREGQKQRLRHGGILAASLELQVLLALPGKTGCCPFKSHLRLAVGSVVINYCDYDYFSRAPRKEGHGRDKRGIAKD